MQNPTNTPRAVQKSLFPAPARASKRSLITAGIVGVLLLLVPVPQMLIEAGILKLAPHVAKAITPVYNQSLISASADAGAFVLLALGLNIVVGYAGLLDLGYAAFFAIGTFTYAILASTPNPSLVI